MKTRTVTRTYQFRFARDPRIKGLLEETYKVYNRGAHFFLNFWSMVMGSIDARSFLSLNDEEMPSVLAAVPAWFSLEEDNETNAKKYLVSPANLGNLFSQYWLASGGSKSDLTHPALGAFFETAPFAKRKNTVWVDQRKRCEEQYGTLPGTDWWTAYNTGDSNQLCRSLLSFWWGAGEKADWNRLKALYDNLHKCVSSLPENTTGEKMIAHVCTALCIPVTTNPETLNQSIAQLFKKQGPDKLRNTLVGLCSTKATLDPETIKFVRDIAKKQCDNASEKQARAKYKWMENLRESFEKEVVSYRGEGDRINEVGQMFCLALQRYKSWHSNFVRQMMERHERQKDFDIKREKFDGIAPIADAMEKNRKDDQQFLTTAQFRGIKRFLAIYEESIKEPNLKKILQEYCAGAHKSRELGDLNIFGELSNVLADYKMDGKRIPYEDVAKTINGYLDLQTSAEKYYCFKSPCLTSLAKQGADPWFGACKGFIEIPVAATPQPSKVYPSEYRRIWIKLSFFNGNNFMTEEAAVLSKRFQKEIYFAADSEVDASRDTPLVRATGKEGLLKIFQDNPDLSGQIKRGGDDWYLNVAVPITVPYIPMKDVANRFMESGASILGVDLGQKNAVAYCHYTTDDKGAVVLANEKARSEYVRLTISDMGFLKERQKSHVYNVKKPEDKTKFRFICRLDPPFRNTLPEDVAVWQMLRARANVFKHKEPPTTIGALNNDVSYCALRYARCAECGTTELMGILQKAREQCEKPGKGALSLSRLSTLMNLKSAFQCMMHRGKNANQEVPLEVTKTIDHLTKRLNHVRRERVRITANLILRKAIETKSSVIAIEDLSIAPNQNSNRKNNRKTTDWCSRAIVQAVEQSAVEFGIVVKKVYPAYSSMQDFCTEELKPRFEIVNPDKLDDKYLKWFLRRPDGERGGVAQAVVMEKLKKYNLEHSPEGIREALRKESKGGKAYLPRNFGAYYPSYLEGWIDSDQAAAATIGKRGLKFLLGWVRKAENDAANDKRKPQLKIPQASLADLCWGVLEKE